MRRASDAAFDMLGFGKRPSGDLINQLNEAREDALEKAEIIEQLNTEQVVTR